MNIPRNEYPRPNFKRNNWINLNGEWDFEFDDANLGEKEKWFLGKQFSRKILVPFCYQSKLSGIGDRSVHDIVWYHRKININKNDKRIFINFGAVDYFTKLYINGNFVGSHKGGHIAFRFDITDFLNDGENDLYLRVEDRSFDCTQPRGKQTWKVDNFACWYTRTTGIWQTVWLENLDDFHLERVKITTDIDNRTIEVEAYFNNILENGLLEVEISFEGKKIKKFWTEIKQKREKFILDVCDDNAQFKIYYWSPEEPKLYDIKFRIIHNGNIKDEVESYFGMRKISIRDGKILLNNKEYYQKLILDQGYYGDGLLTAPSDEWFVEDIKKIKDMGFNGLRKHQKIEDQRFLYYCDKYGLLVWAEMPSTYEFNDIAIENIIYEWQEAVKQQYNHPCIITWTLLNESWGVNEIYNNKKQQSLANALYFYIKALDSSRLLISNDGWEHTISDILTIHDYIEDGEIFRKLYLEKEKIVNGAASIINPKFNFAEGYKYEGQPVLLSEYGGIAFSNVEGWGYGNKVRTEEEFLERFKKITHAIMDIPYICGFCYTQLTDVEQEMNGLMDWYHKMKFDPEKIKKIING
ncbi:glycoside hydrolase family 2 TIM barrel-domain containing protein [Caloramator sp. CAR-1]|uniref:glycoside hydrolase family 2 protein n=1 Tax=Caloramator sp. CAR-1 TaxID=3062777 RepID=UPI0026E161AB|nr:sugar-binding domain-containing protein [Caloramator sp. CAR-1]MDO6355877.1 glycoside hydrolase family 2 TIM barrel-domain containing protein [Caloramator sp. CAR-1]